MFKSRKKKEFYFKNGCYVNNFRTTTLPYPIMIT